ncbi:MULTISPECIES: helix-turn-helix domain-containing protein [Streptomyces]|uniref:XRE family transcriptional regulator n=1 Tax=Streptomyces kasugaensis TaxID=1946 RepID=A0A4V6MU24_STRKA|nr:MULTISPECIES: helix-turn-helix transcriptional regulator [Streptomyces]MYU51660.1 helix-turn-helix domain-containing protein [Streptomyces sp. SID7805]TBO58621.1 XRE family transcriptional regulator [Streptomyces kasugaensis]
MAYADELDPSASVLSFYATDLRRRRELAGISQRDLAKRAHMAPSLLNKIEATKRLPTKDLSELCDEIFGTGDHFQRLWPLVIKYAYPSWFRPYVDLEEAATIIRSFQVQVVPGLLQTEDYARAVFSARRPDTDRVEEQVTARMERQHILGRKIPPKLWVVLDENVLRRRMGSPETMRAQLERVMSAADAPSNVIQVVPYDAGEHAGVAGPFEVLALDEGPDVVYVDGFLQGQILAESEHVRAAERAYDLLTAVALSPGRSIDLIADAMKDLSP